MKIALCLLLFTSTLVATEAPTTLPQIDVSSNRPGRFSTVRIVESADAPRMLVVAPRVSSPDSTYLYGDFKIGDEIVRVSGRDLASFKLGEISDHLRAGSKVTVKRRIALGKFELVEVESRRATPKK